MPEPQAGETHDDFIERCMGDAEAVEDFPDDDQRLAFCESTWEDEEAQQANPLSKAPKCWRGNISRGLDRSGQVIRDGGEKGAGIIKGVSVLTRGEAAGHDFWIDNTMLLQTARAISRSTRGIKARFTHPSLSGDGLGKYLGRVKSGRKSLDQAYADLHLSETAHNTPDGDLAGYVMDLAEKEPDSFGTSIQFFHDSRAEEAHAKDGTSDELNTQGLPHARLAELRAVDAVDDPAANPEGLFHRGQEIAQEADHLLAYALGMETARPQMSTLEFDPDRIRAFAQRWMGEHGVSILRSKPNDPGTEARKAALRRALEFPQPQGLDFL